MTPYVLLDDSSSRCPKCSRAVRLLHGEGLASFYICRACPFVGHIGAGPVPDESSTHAKLACELVNEALTHTLNEPVTVDLDALKARIEKESGMAVARVWLDGTTVHWDWVGAERERDVDPEELPTDEVHPPGWTPPEPTTAVELTNGHGATLCFKKRGHAFRIISFTRPPQFSRLDRESPTTDLWFSIEEMVKALQTPV